MLSGILSLFVFPYPLDAEGTEGLNVLCYFSDLVVLFVTSLSGPHPPLLGAVLTSDPSSLVPYLIPLLDGMFSCCSINLELAGVSSEGFVGSSGESQGIIIMLNQNKCSQNQKKRIVNGIK